MKRQVKTTMMFFIPALLALSSVASAGIAGITGAPCGGVDTCFNLTARAGHIALGDGNSLLTWSYGDDDGGTGQMQYPGPTLIVTQGDVVQVTLNNTLSEPTSIVFPGQIGVAASGGTAGQITNEATNGAGAVTYTFTASEPGTYMYQSGSHAELQIQMGLVGALIIRPAAGGEGTAYGSPSTQYDREYLFFLTEMDRAAHEAVELGVPVDVAGYNATLWFINGRNGPDTLHPDNAGWMPLQPYGSLAQMEPGERVLMRIVAAGLDMHPFHHHGNNAWIIAEDGRVLESSADASAAYPDFLPPSRTGLELLPIQSLVDRGATLPDEAVSNYTVLVSPGSTYDSIFTWTGIGMNWDIYGNRPGHAPGDCGAMQPDEDPNGHCQALESLVTLPEQQAMTFGGLWTGSAFLGSLDALPPDQGGLNPNGGFSYMWHSHTERELTNDDIFPGGMMTFMIIEAPGTLD